ncbi:MAG: DUF5916 domain-containing protein [Rhodothermales bacterium]|nr:DUF5916 domain-containing protein [Rhodothermales bacterium]
MPNTLPSVQIPATTARITVDGDLTDEGWRTAAVARNFSETFPGDQTEPPIGIEVRMAYDATHLYIAYQVEDDPAAIRANLSDRDQIWQDDYAGMILDVGGDGQESVFIAANPLGIQGDTRSTRGNEDVGYDLLYRSEGRITETGYQIEMAIPFRSLRFPQRDVQQWRATFWITRPRESRNTYSWAAIDRDDPCFSCQLGTLEGMRGVRSGNNLEILPSVTGAQTAHRLGAGTPGAAFDNGRLSAEPSLDVKYGITSDLTLDVTVNPDFSQIESDAAQIDVNSTFALFFPERRPFFQEGSNLFQTPIQAVYTRSINNPLSAAKLTGRFGATSLAVVSARDRDTPVLLPFEEQSAFVQAGASVSNLARVQHAFGQDAYLGAVLTDQRLDGGGGGSLVGVDGSVRFLKKYSLKGQFVASRTAEPVDAALSEQVDGTLTFGDGYTAAFDGETFWGHAFAAGVERDARHWSFRADAEQMSPTFRAANGFVTQNATRRVMSAQRYTFYPERLGFVDRINVSAHGGRIWNYDGEMKDTWVSPGVFLMMKHQTMANVSYVFSRERFGGTEFGGVRRLNLFVRSNFSEPVQLGFHVSRGRSIARMLEAPELGRSVNASVFGTLRPTARLTLNPNLDYARLADLDTGEAFFSGYIARVRATYQFTRRFFLRTIVQYNDFSERLNVDPLLTYRINPFTVFYVGSTHSIATYPGVGDETDRFWQQTQRQFFFKFQYLFRR